MCYFELTKAEKALLKRTEKDFNSAKLYRITTLESFIANLFEAKGGDKYYNLLKYMQS